MKLPEIKVSGGLYIGSALAILVIPWKVLAAFVVATTVHECCHLAALRWIGIPVAAVRLGLFGAQITTGFMTPKQELVCAFAGPAGSLARVLFARQLPMSAVFGLCQGLCNLLPVYPLDGGRILRSIFLLAKIDRSGYNSADNLQRGILP